MEVVEVAVEVAVDVVEVDRVIDQWSLIRGLCGVPNAQMPWTVINLG